MKNATVQTSTNYVSLFDYQGHRDKDKIGKNVYEYAKFRGVKPIPRNVSLNNGPTLQVMTYPRDLLVEYFDLKDEVKSISKFFPNVL